MPAVQVRDFSQDTYNKIKREARKNGRSITQQTKQIVLEHFRALDERQANPETDQIVGHEMATLQPAYGQQTNPFWAEGDEELQQRAQRRRALFARIEGRSYPKAACALDSEQLIREARDAR